MLWTLGLAHAALTVHATEGRVVISIDGEVAAATPVSLEDLDPGAHTLGFWDPSAGREIFSMSVDVSGEQHLVVDLDAKRATLQDAAPGAPAASPVSAAPAVAAAAAPATTTGAPAPTAAAPTAEPVPSVASASVAPAPAPVAASPGRSARRGKATTDEPAAVTTASTTDVGSLFVKSSVDGATVFVDGVPQADLAPAMFRDIPVGGHVVTLVEGCEAARGDVVVEAGKIARAELTLATEAGKADFSVSPGSATLTIDGHALRQWPVTMTCGEHTWEASAPKHHDAAGSFFVQPLLTTQVDVTLQAMAWGSLVVDVTPFDAEIRLDGELVGEGPMTLDDLLAGPHTVTASADGYRTATLDHDQVGDQVQTWTVTLEAGADPVAVAVAPAPAAPEPEPEPEPVPAAPSPEPVVAVATAAPAPTSAPTGERSGASPARVALDVVVTGATVAAAGTGLWAYSRAREAYSVYYDIATPSSAEAFYDESVVPLRNLTWACAGAAIVGAGASAALWVTTDFSDTGFVGLRGRF